MKPIYLVVTPFFPTYDSFRGPFVYDQVKAIASHDKYEVIILKSSPRISGYDRYFYDGLEVLLFPFKQSPSYILNGFFNKCNAKSALRRLNKEGIDIDRIKVVHCHTSSYGAIGLAIKDINQDVKVFLQHHDKDPFTVLNGKLSGWDFNVRYRAKKNIEIFNNVDCHICISKVCRENLLAFPMAGVQEKYEPYLRRMKQMKGLPSITPKSCVILYNGVNTDKFYPSSGTDHQKNFVIGCIGNFIALKGHTDLIKALAIFKKRNPEIGFELQLVGSGPEETSIRQCVMDCDLCDEVKFIKEVDHRQLKVFYQNLDLFVLPSHFDGFGCVCTEAAACGVPFMISEGQGAAEYVVPEEKNMWCFVPGDYEMLARRIENFQKTRPKQNLAYPMDIDTLVSNFLSETGL
ncbi:MAG: glycosyltransferase family 4 protein [Muribaculaceae bacterium]|nr:glycosyltransferase family 4 protein [Muribaculaceae bacterium]